MSIYTSGLLYVGLLVPVFKVDCCAQRFRITAPVHQNRLVLYVYPPLSCYPAHASHRTATVSGGPPLRSLQSKEQRCCNQGEGGGKESTTAASTKHLEKLRTVVLLKAIILGVYYDIIITISQI